MRWLVTGANGFIGSAVVARLRARGDRVRALVLPGTGSAELEALGAEPVPGDVTQPRSLGGSVEGCDAVVHLAGLVKALRVGDFYRVNAAGTANLAAACAAARPRPVLVFVSSLSAAGPSRPERARREEDPPAPVSHYGRSKLEGEGALRALSDRLEATVVRPPITYGPRDRETLPPLFRMARLGLALKCGLGARVYSLVHVDDLADGILAAAVRGRRLEPRGDQGLYYLSDGGVHGWAEVCRAAAEALGSRVAVLTVPGAASLAVALGCALAAEVTRRPAFLAFDKMREIRCRAWTCAIDRARRELQYAPRLPLPEGLRRSAAWFRARDSLEAWTRLPEVPWKDGSQKAV
ncbi:MAG TPA: NAD-dependent epimerase/dehydratase family protein [Anaeromyxobacteraceae bacterium]|nr:NAD-dependent epimerase/dehydratase family protein [Anaeromyxobacteraceae bacterium]